MRLVVLVLLALLVGCGSVAPPAPSARHPRPVTRAEAGRVLRDLAPVRGFAAAAYCLGGGGARCDRPAEPRWAAYAEWRGPRLGHGTAGPDVPRAFYLVGVLAHHDPGVADSLVREVERRSPAGPVHEQVQVERGRTYVYGRHGRAVLRSTRVDGWTGVVSVSRVDLLRRHAGPVHDVVQVDSTLHRGAVSVQVIGWLDATTGRDPAVVLDALTRQVLARLDGPDDAPVTR